MFTHTLSLTRFGLIQTMIYFHILMPHIKYSNSDHLWDLIETWGFREDIKDVKDKGLYRYLWFWREHQGY